MDNLRLLITDNSILFTKKGKVLLKETFSTDEEAIKLINPILDQNKKTPVECLLSGSRLTTSTRTLHYSNPAPFIIDKKMQDLLIEKASLSFLEEYKDKQLEIVQEKVLVNILNGYAVKELKKQKATDISLSIFFAALPKEFKKHFKEDVTFSAFAYHLIESVYKATNKDDFITCSVYEHSTDLSIRKIGGFFQTITVPIGTHHVLEHVQKGLSLGIEEATTALEGTPTPTIESAIQSFQITMDAEMGKALSQLSEGICLPTDVYLLVAPTFQKAFENIFRNECYHSTCFTEKGFEVKSMSSIIKT
jgi:hypothetical protein